MEMADSIVWHEVDIAAVVFSSSATLSYLYFLLHSLFLTVMLRCYSTMIKERYNITSREREKKLEENPSENRLPPHKTQNKKTRKKNTQNSS